MPKKKSKKDKDFQKVKFKVGKKLPKAENVTSTAFKSKSIIVKEQLKETSTDDLRQDILNKSRNPQELLAHLQHYNPSFRLNSLNTIKAIMTSDPNKLALHIGAVIDRVSSLTSDKERDIRAAVLECLRSIFRKLNATEIAAFIPTITAHLRCAMTHLTEDVKLDSLKFLDLLVAHYPSALNKDMFRIIENFLDLISTRSVKGKRSLKVSPNSKMTTVKWRQQAFIHLEKLLSIRVESGAQQIDSGVQQIDNLHSPIPMELNDEVCNNIQHCELPDSGIPRHAFLATSGLEEYLIRHHSIGSSSDFSEEAMVLRFIGEILPLLRETWVEVKASDSLAGGDFCNSLVSVVDIMNQLYQLVINSEIKDPQPALNLLQLEVRHCIVNGFPISHSGSNSSKTYNRGSKKANSKFDISSSTSVLNLKLCLLANLLGCATMTTQRHLGQLISQDNLEEFANHLEVMLQNVEPGEILESIIVNLVSRQHCSEARVPLLVSIINKQIMSKHRLNEDTGNALFALICKDELSLDAQVSLLSALNRACLSKKFALGVDDFSVLFNGLIKKHTNINQMVEKEKSVLSREDRQQLKLVFTLLSHVDSISVGILKSLTQLLWQPYLVPAALIDFLLNILHTRTLDDGLSMSLYISFLSTLLGGDVSMPTHPDHLAHQTEHIVKAILKHVHLAFPNSKQVIALMEHFFMNVKMTNDRIIPFCTCTSLMEAFYLTTHFSNEFICEAAIDYLTHLTCETPVNKPATDDGGGGGVNLLDCYGTKMLARCGTLRPDVLQMVYTKLAADCSSRESQIHTGKIISLIMSCHPDIEVGK